MAPIMRTTNSPVYNFKGVISLDKCTDGLRKRKKAVPCESISAAGVSILIDLLLRRIL
jgi:hypothetical protein